MDGFVARQPILDGRGSLYAYELLFRAGPENVFGAEGDSDNASLSVIRNSLTGFGLDAMTGGHRAFINTTRHVLVQGLYRALPPNIAVIELLETVEADDEVIAACRQVKADGYLLALDDFVMRPELEPLLQFADFVKVDFLATTARERKSWMARLGSSAVRLLAEKVETRAQFEQALAEGFTYFQGYYFHRPEMFSATVIPPFKLNALRILRELNSATFELERIEAITREESELAQKLLGDLNSLPFAARSPVYTVRQARELLGEEAFRRWATLVALQCLGEDRPREFAATCLVRGRFGELVAQKLGVDRAAMFLIGILSASDALIGRPLSEIVSQVSLPRALEAALLDRPGPERDVLRLIMGYERGDWVGVSVSARDVGFPEDRLPSLFQQAVEWTNRVWA